MEGGAHGVEREKDFRRGYLDLTFTIIYLKEVFPLSSHDLGHLKSLFPYVYMYCMYVYTVQ